MDLSLKSFNSKDVLRMDLDQDTTVNKLDVQTESDRHGYFKDINMNRVEPDQVTPIDYSENMPIKVEPSTTLDHESSPKISPPVQADKLITERQPSPDDVKRPAAKRRRKNSVISKLETPSPVGKGSLNRETNLLPQMDSPCSSLSSSQEQIQLHISTNSSSLNGAGDEGESEEVESTGIPADGEWSRYWCRVCDKQFRSNIGLQRHEIEDHSKIMVECDSCTKMFRSESALSDHKKRVHGPRQYACGLCNADFTSEAYLRAHAKVHAEKKHICPQCDHSFVNKTDLNNHMRVHNGDKPYPCNVCGKRFRHVSGFYTHVRIHTGETPYQCDFCEKMFTNASNYQTHRKIHTREKKFKCEECGKEFIQQSNFSRHMRIHTKERPYACRKCEAKFTYSTALKRHEEREHGIMPFPCEKCGRTFLNQMSLVRHRTGCQLKDCVKTVAQESSSQFL